MILFKIKDMILIKNGKIKEYQDENPCRDKILNHYAFMSRSHLKMISSKVGIFTLKIKQVLLLRLLARILNNSPS